MNNLPPIKKINGNRLRKAFGIDHSDTQFFAGDYSFIQLKGKVKATKDGALLLVPDPDIVINERTLVAVNSKLYLAGTVQCPTILEPEDALFVTFVGEELPSIDWLFRLYVMR